MLESVLIILETECLPLKLTIILLLTVIIPTWGDVPLLPKSVALPPVIAFQGDSLKLIVVESDPWITPGETSELTESPDYAQTVAWLKKLSKASPLIELSVFGHTSEGRELIVAVASREEQRSGAYDGRQPVWERL